MSVDGRGPTIQSVFPPEVVTATTTSPALASLHPAERACVAGAGLRRRLDFAAGRLCARRALAKLGAPDFPLLIGPKGEPVWPPGAVGSISHCQGCCGAAVTWERQIRSIGLDMERIQALDDGFTEIVCTRRERNWIRSQPSRRRPVATILLFSAKESFYKCQFPLTGAWLEFQDVQISIEMDREQFEVESAAAGEPAGTVRFTGRYLVRDGYVFTGVIARILESSCQS